MVTKCVWLVALLLVCVCLVRGENPEDGQVDKGQDYIKNRKVFYSMLDVRKLFKYSSFRFELIEGVRHMWVVTGPITVFSKDLNSYEKFTLNNPMGKTWYHAICTTKILKFKGKSKSMLYALWNLISEVQLEENWAKVNEISKLVIFNDENSEYGKTFDKPAEDGSDCYIQATFSEYFRAVAKQPQSYDLQDCLNAEFAAVAVDWPHAFPCYTKDQMEIKKKKIADSKKQIRSIYN